MTGPMLKGWISGSEVLSSRGFVYEKKLARSSRVVGEVRQSVYYESGRFGYIDASLAISLIDMEEVGELRFEPMQIRITELFPEHSALIQSFGLSRLMEGVDDQGALFESLLAECFPRYFDRLASLEQICQGANAFWRREKPFSGWRFSRPILEKCGVIPPLD